jgi:bacterial/archaeal transporter family-2 protein
MKQAGLWLTPSGVYWAAENRARRRISSAVSQQPTNGALQMKVHLVLFTTFLVVILAVHLAMSGKVGSVIVNARVGDAVFWCIGALMVVLTGLSGWQSGAGLVMTTVPAGQVIGGLVMSHFGWLGSPVESITFMKIDGVAVMTGGVAMATFSK